MQAAAAEWHISQSLSVQGVQSSAEASREPGVSHQSGYAANGALAGHSASGLEGALSPAVVQDLQQQLVKSRDEADEQLKQARWALIHRDMLVSYRAVISGLHVKVAHLNHDRCAAVDHFCRTVVASLSCS